MRVIDLASLSMIGGSGIAESKIPLWFADGTNGNYVTNTGWTYIMDGTTTQTTNTGLSQENLFSLSSNWPLTLNYAFEATIWISGGSGYGIAALTDTTSSSVLGATEVITSSTTAITVRSGKFTLTSGHKFGISLNANGTSGIYICDASLIAFPQ